MRFIKNPLTALCAYHRVYVIGGVAAWAVIVLIVIGSLYVVSDDVE